MGKLTFRFAHEQASRGNQDGRRILQAILSKLYCPNVTTLTFDASRNNPGANYYSGNGPLLFHQFFSGISNRFPKVVKYNIVVSKAASDFDTSEPTSLPMHFPADDFEHLSFISDTPLSFPDADAQKTVPMLWRLRTLTLGVNPLPNYDTSAAIDWVRWLIGHLRSQGDWDAFEKLVLLKYVRKDDIYEYEKTVYRDEIDTWCKSRYVFPELQPPRRSGYW